MNRPICVQSERQGRDNFIDLNGIVVVAQVEAQPSDKKQRASLRAQEFYIIFTMKLIDLLLRRCSRQINVHGMVHTICIDNLIGQEQSPRFHGMRKTKMRFFDLGIGMVRHPVAFRTLYSICRGFNGDLLVESERRHGIRPRLLVLLNDDVVGSGHDEQLGGVMRSD